TGDADPVAERQPATQPDSPTHQGDHGDEPGRAGDAAGEQARARRPGGPGVAHWLLGRDRPSSSSQRRGGVFSITVVKLTRSEASVSAVTTARERVRARGLWCCTNARPSTAPSGLAPVSP